MFTGLIEEIGTVASLTRQGTGASVVVRMQDASNIALGDSIAIDGCCLTATAVTKTTFTADASAETLARTTLGDRKPGDSINIERALAAGARMGGHMVQGHVDDVGVVTGIRADGETCVMEFEIPEPLARYVASKGSIAINGTSLTVNGVSDNRFWVTLIPHTLSHTTLGSTRVGARVNLETDVIAKHVVRTLEAMATASPTGISMALLQRQGFANTTGARNG